MVSIVSWIRSCFWVVGLTVATVFMGCTSSDVPSKPEPSATDAVTKDVREVAASPDTAAKVVPTLITSPSTGETGVVKPTKAS